MRPLQLVLIAAALALTGGAVASLRAADGCSTCNSDYTACIYDCGYPNDTIECDCACNQELEGCLGEQGCPIPPPPPACNQ